MEGASQNTAGSIQPGHIKAFGLPCALDGATTNLIEVLLVRSVGVPSLIVRVERRLSSSRGLGSTDVPFLV